MSSDCSIPCGFFNHNPQTFHVSVRDPGYRHLWRYHGQLLRSDWAKRLLLPLLLIGRPLRFVIPHP